ncbi:coiled-coil domain-containing protein [Enterococcus gallinarum]|uniref:coiled-coil domain-containing protein n=1 Tax=Enterococcus gallinarum TaxID=1353 RepID=UPI001AD73762|nr:hypothetical protein [Enterococcus gallinarum]MBO6420060.1 hypothetical protein [Enterococcus gallinarum]MBO6423057.1 hypothetical protein [Enterococcus gallinarum]
MKKIKELFERIETFRDDFQKGQAQKSKVKQKRAKLSPIIYQGMFLLTLVGTLFFFSSRLLFEDDSPIIDSGVGAESSQKIGNDTVQIYQRTYNPETNYMEVIFLTSRNETSVNREYQAFAGSVKEGNKGIALESKLEPLYDNYYLLTIPEVPKKWTTILIDFGYSEKNISVNPTYNQEGEMVFEDQEEVNQTSFNIDYRKVQTNSTLKKRNVNDYVLELTEKDIEKVIEERKKLKESIKKIESEIEKTKSKIIENETSTEYLTEGEKEEIENANKQLNSQIDSYQKAIEEAQKQIEAIDERRQKLIDRNQAAQVENKNK